MCTYSISCRLYLPSRMASLFFVQCSSNVRTEHTSPMGSLGVYYQFCKEINVAYFTFQFTSTKTMITKAMITLDEPSLKSLLLKDHLASLQKDTVLKARQLVIYVIVALRI